MFPSGDARHSHGLTLHKRTTLAVLIKVSSVCVCVCVGGGGGGERKEERGGGVGGNKN